MPAPRNSASCARRVAITRSAVSIAVTVLIIARKIAWNWAASFCRCALFHCPPSGSSELDRLKGPLLRHHHVALLGQFQTGGQGAGPGRPPPQGDLCLTLDPLGRLRQQLFEGDFTRRRRQPTQNARASFADGVERK